MYNELNFTFFVVAYLLTTIGAGNPSFNVSNIDINKMKKKTEPERRQRSFYFNSNPKDLCTT